MLASGDPKKIQQATAPATERIAASYEGEKKQIEDNLPRGGARDLAIQEADISKAGAIGSTQAQSYLSSFPALAQLGGQGIGLSINEVSNAIAAFGGASNSNQALGNMEGEGKAQTLGFFGSLVQAGGEVGAGFAPHCWVAIALWGENDVRTVRLRVWLSDVYSKTWTGRAFNWFYCRYGVRLAKQVQAHTWVRRLVTPLFDHLNRQAYRWEVEWAKGLEHLREIGAI